VDLGLATGQPLPKGALFELARLLHGLGRFDECERRARQGLERRPTDFALNNLLGVALKNLGRYPEALEALAKAQKAEPKNSSPLVNRGNVYLAMADGPRAVDTYRRLVRAQPKDAEHQRLLGVALRLSGDFDRALKQLELARRLNPRAARAWIDSARLLRDLGRIDEAIELIERAIAANGETQDLVSAKGHLLRAAGRHEAARVYLAGLLAQAQGAAWLHDQLALTLMPFDREQANVSYREALRLEPENLRYRAALAESLDRTRSGDEAANVQEAYELALQCVLQGGDLKPHARVLRSILERCGDYANADRVGDFESLGRFWANTNEPAALHHQLARVESAADRRLLVDFHRTWGRGVDALAERSPIARPTRNGLRERIRIGFMSSDLRNHPVAYFVLPLLEGYDRSRFEVYCYSWCTRPADNVQDHIAGIVQAFRLAPGRSARDCAQLIADDDLDILFELGGTTDMNKLDTMTWRPAPVQASWLGYPHSSGLGSIDYILVDPYLKPEDPGLLIERPFELERSWVVLGRLGFHDRHAIDPVIPEERLGRLTFGTMNNPYKYRPRVLAAWAECVRRVPGSRFLFVRPEGGTPAFRENMWRAFEAGGVTRDRVEYLSVRGTHMQHYNAIDIALDTFPQTGGTTTCECLWMGVPVVTLVGEAFFERLSYSNLVNAGLGDLCAFDLDGYVEKALRLAADPLRRRELRSGLRAEIRRQPLGRADLFVEDFQHTVERTLAEAGGRAAR
jgi:predicted O-linked N-acetylglucosamine transferase (SPINDLY family)